MKRRMNALAIILILPFIYICTLFFANRFIQPKALHIAHSDKPTETVYFDTDDLYVLTGDIIGFPGVLLEPAKGSFTKLNDFVSTAKSTYDFFYASSIAEFNRPQCVVDDKYVVTLAFNAKLPSDMEYSIWFPAEFCEYKVYVNGELVTVSPTFGSESPRFPRHFICDLPPVSDGCYTIVVQIISPVNYINSCPDTIFFGTTPRLHSAFDGINKVGLFMAAYVIFTMVFMLIQLVALRFESVIIPFFCFSGMTCIVMSFMDDRVIMTFIPLLSAGIGSFVEAIAKPIYLLSLMFFTVGLFKDSFPKRVSYVISIMLLIPMLDALTLGQFGFLKEVSIIVSLAPYILCGYTFVKAYEKKEPNATSYGIALGLVAGNLMLYRLTYNMAVPSQFAYSVSYIIWSVAMVTILGREYAAQNANESFYTAEL